MARKETVPLWLELSEDYSVVDGLAALGRKQRWAQGQLNNPRYGELARLILRHKELLREHIEAGAASTSAIAPMPPAAMDNDQSVRAYWQGLKLAGTLHTEERWKKLSGHAELVGVPQERLKELVGDTESMGELAHAISELRADARIAPADIERALAEAGDAVDALARLAKLREPARRPDRVHRRELLDGLRGLLLQDTLTLSTREALSRTAGRKGLSPVRTRKLLKATVSVRDAFREGQVDPHRHIGVSSAASPKRARQSYRRLRDGLLAQELSWERMEQIARVDAAWSVVSSERG